MQSFMRVVKSGFSSFVRNGWLSVASITVMVLTLLTLSVFFVVNVALSMGIKSIQDKIDISVYLKDDAKQALVIDMQNELASKSEIKSIKYVSKSDALARFREQYKNNQALLDSISENDNSLPASLEIKVYDPDKLNIVSQVIGQDKYKDAIQKISFQDNKLAIDKLLRATNLIRNLGIGITIVFTLVSLIIIFNTVRMAIFARMEEIEVMKLVGATPSFIKGPFLVEGALYGIIATIISITIMGAVLYFSTPTIIRSFSDVGSNINSFMSENLFVIVLLQLIFGLILGIGSSWLAIRKHLKLV